VGNILGELILFDVETQEDITTFEPHSKRIGCIDWRGDRIATGSKDGKIALFDARKGFRASYEYRKGNSGEICGVQFSPNRDLVLSGGNEGKFNVFSAKGNHCMMKGEHNGAIRGLAWSLSQHNIFYTGGGKNDRKLKKWNYSKKVKVAERESRGQICSLAFN
jgi:cell division cycle 20-like protein 1 (cofactor of APC complex)